MTPWRSPTWAGMGTGRLPGSLLEGVLPQIQQHRVAPKRVDSAGSTLRRWEGGTRMRDAGGPVGWRQKHSFEQAVTWAATSTCRFSKMLQGATRPCVPLQGLSQHGNSSWLHTHGSQCCHALEPRMSEPCLPDLLTWSGLL